MKFTKTIFVFSLLSVIFFATACEDKETEEATLLEFGSISGAVNFFGVGVMLGSILCWGLGLSVFYVIILACSPSF